MINDIENDRQPYVTAMDGKKALELVLAIYKSASEGGIVKLQLTDCDSIDFKGRFEWRIKTPSWQYKND